MIKMDPFLFIYLFWFLNTAFVLINKGSSSKVSYSVQLMYSPKPKYLLLKNRKIASMESVLRNRFIKGSEISFVEMLYLNSVFLLNIFVYRIA